MASSREDTDDTESFDDSFSDDDDNHEPLNQGKHKEAFSTLVECLYKRHLHFTNFLENWLLSYSLKCLFQQKRKNHCSLTVFSILKASLCLNQGLGHVRRLEQENSSNVMNTTNSSNVGRELKLIGENTLMTS